MMELESGPCLNQYGGEKLACGNSLTDARFYTSQFEPKVALLNLSSLARRVR